MSFFSTLFVTALSLSTPAFAQETTLLSQLQTKRETIRQWAPLCEDGTQNHGECPFFDMTIFSGLACLSGEKDRCEDVRRAQGPDGRWWRAPGFVGQEDQIDSFSRDQARGALAYLVATKDVEAAKRWQAYIDRNDTRMCGKASNNRCKITNGISWLFAATWDYLGIPRAKWMGKGRWIANFYEQIEALTQPKDYPMHLNASYAWIRREIERRGGPKVNKEDQKVLKILLKRQPNNPYFKLLREGPTDEVAKLILQKCPDKKPVVEGRLDWAWQRGEDSKAWERASGHECIYIINVFERELELLKK